MQDYAALNHNHNPCSIKHITCKPLSSQLHKKACTKVIAISSLLPTFSACATDVPFLLMLKSIGMVQMPLWGGGPV